MTQIERIREKLKAELSAKERKQFQGDNAIYPFWNIPDGTSTSIRFLPDGNETNQFFWVEKLVIRLPFDGVKGGSNKPITVTVPCVDMWGEKCPIIEAIKPWWKDESTKRDAQTYYKKRSFLLQGFVLTDVLEEEAPENPIRRVTLNSGIIDIIKASLMDPDMEYIPTDYVNGRDFKIVKHMKGGFANYSTSSWAMKQRPLTDAEHVALRDYGLQDLSHFLPRRPTPEMMEIIKQLFDSSVNGDAYDSERFGNYYNPMRNEVEPGAETKAAVTPVVTPEVAPEVVTSVLASESLAQTPEELLKFLKRKQRQKAS